MKLLDLFCGAGGAAKGYQRAGWYVVGVDINPQPHYCGDEFYQGDFRDVLNGNWTPRFPMARQFDAIHASPPCQLHSAMHRATKAANPELIGPARQLLDSTGLPYIIENVEHAPLHDAWILCGTMFGLEIRRHRAFELNFPVSALLPPCNCRGRVANGELMGHRLAGRVAPGRRQPPSRPESSRLGAYGVPWMSAREARQAVPPAYTEWVGKQLLAALEVAA